MVLKNNEISPLQGEIWLFDPDPVRGHEIGKKVRPCLIISNSQWNKIRTGLVIIVPLTSVCKDIATHVKIEPMENGVKVESYAACEHLRSISRERLIKKQGRVNTEVLKQVRMWITDLLRLDFA